MTVIIDKELQQAVIDRVTAILGDDDSGHGMDHVMRVHEMSIRFAAELPKRVDEGVVSLAALLHDVDDYKLVGEEQADRLTNATDIMEGVGVDEDGQRAVRKVIANMGYRKALRGIRPCSIEGQIVSDADMCDAIGASGIIRALSYALSSKGSKTLFDPEIWPAVDITAEEYNSTGSSHSTDSFINHFFEKLLRLKGMMITQPGRQEAIMRDAQMVDFLRSYFREEGATGWSEFLERYLDAR